jgi:bacteriorhodopsin
MNAAACTMNLLYVITLLFSGFFFLVMKFRWKHLVPEIFFWLHFFIVTWSAMMYLNLVYQTPLAPYAYYADWIVSTPLIMLAVGLTAMYPLKAIEVTPLFAIMMTQVMIILTGLLAQASSNIESLQAFFWLGNALMLIIFYIIFGPLMAIAKSNAILFPKYRKLAYILVVFWISYPAVWITGSIGYGFISAHTTTIMFIILPILCKPVFGFIDLYLLKRVNEES